MSGVFVHFINTSLFITIYGQNWYCNCIRLLTSNIYWCWIWTSWNMSSFHIFIDILLTTFMFQSLIEAFLLKKKKRKILCKYICTIFVIRRYFFPFFPVLFKTIFWPFWGLGSTTMLSFLVPVSQFHLYSHKFYLSNNN